MNDISKHLWGFWAVFGLIVLVTAIYAISTWSTPSTDKFSTKQFGNHMNQLPDQNNMGPSLQAQPGTGQSINGGGNSATLQQGSAQKIQQDNSMYPIDPDGCRGENPSSPQTMCLAQ